MTGPDDATSSTRHSAIHGSRPESLTNDILKCALKPLRAEDYKQSLTDEQIERLKAVFPRGVCDYIRPGEEQTGAPEPWRKY